MLRDRQRGLSRATLLVSLFGLVGAACAPEAGTQVTRLSHVTVKPEWVRVNCALRLPKEEYAACVRARAEAAGPLDPSKRDQYGEFYDPAKYVECRVGIDPANMRCEYLILRRRGQPEFWPYPDVPKPKLPEPPNSPVYKPGMTSREYFQALCKAEAGEFIYRTVENVEGLYQIRPRIEATSNEIGDRLVLEDPYGHTDVEARRSQIYFLQPPFGKYQFFEVPDPTRFPGGWIRFLRGDPKASTEEFKYQAGPELGYRTLATPFLVQKQLTDRLLSRYGYTWRAISRPHDRANNIAGGEVVVLDLKTNEVLAIRRGFVLAPAIKEVPWHPLNWEAGAVCPAKPLAGPAEFITKVLKPMTPSQ
jgi:hypothetical protein